MSQNMHANTLAGIWRNAGLATLLGALCLTAGCEMVNGPTSFQKPSEGGPQAAAPADSAGNADRTARGNVSKTAAAPPFDRTSGAVGRGAAGSPGPGSSPEATFPVGGPANAGSADPGRGLTTFGLYGQLPDDSAARASTLDGENLRQITFATEGADYDPDLDPTGAWVVFSSTRHRTTSDIYLQRVDGTSVTQLTDDAGNDVQPRFSPDGKRVAFASDRTGNWAIYVMSVDGKKPIQITTDANQNLHPSWSSDGKHLVYCTYGTQSGQWELVVVDVDNPAQKRFVGYGLFPNWSPVDNKIVFQKARQRGSRWFSVWTIDYVDGEGRNPTEVAASSNSAVITPQWSPDGKRLVFCTVINPDSERRESNNAADLAKPATADIWVMNSDGSGRTNLTHSKFLSVQPVWSHDGSIYFVTNRAKNGIENVWAIRPDKPGMGGEPVVERTAPGATPAPANEAQHEAAHETKTAEEPHAKVETAHGEPTSAE